MLKLWHAKPRKPQPRQWYSHKRWDNDIEPTYRRLLAESDGTVPAIKFVGMAIDQCWAAETNEYKAELQKELQDLYEGQLHDWDELSNAVDGIAIDAKERSRYVTAYWNSYIIH
jgi:hypothetical protein